MTWNNPYLSTPGAGANWANSAATTVLSDLSISGTLQTGAVESASAASFGAVTGSVVSSLATVLGSEFSSTDATSGVFGASAGTTTSVDSTLLGDREFGFFRSTHSTVDLIYRSGNTLYHWASSQGSVA